MRAIGTALVLVAILAGPATAQVRYKDDEGVVHFVDSINEVPAKYRAGAVGNPTPKAQPAQPSGIDWEQKVRDADRERAARGRASEAAAERSRKAIEAQCEAR
jgi:hypothetical protein